MTWPRRSSVFVLALIVGFAFGAADQYLGSLHVCLRLGFWAATVSGLSAPWLLLPFLFGCSQQSPRRAAALGLLATMAGLAGYFAMMWGPIEGGTWTQFAAHWPILLASQSVNIIGGVLCGPLFGYLGQRWHAHRSWAGAMLVAGAFCFEPLARLAAGRLDPPAFIWALEVALGIALALYFIASGTDRRQTA